uniref:Uncharacterized protein n=1 Tax=Panagrolaimus sp. ES5 TaxID=591445 RepID=A0AC34G036_9BILA
MDPPPSYDDVENGYSRNPTAPKENTRISAAARNARCPHVVAPASQINAVYTINAGAGVQQQPGNSTVYIQGEPVYIIPKSAVDQARARASFRRNCILCFVITKIFVIAVVVIIIIVSTN